MGKCSVASLSDGEIQMATWSYRGSGASHGPGNPKRFSFEFRPDFVAINGGSTTLVRSTEWVSFSNGINSNVSWGDKDVSVWHRDAGTIPVYTFDDANTLYHVFAIGRKGG